jgi:hypothetical protein
MPIDSSTYKAQPQEMQKRPTDANATGGTAIGDIDFIQCTNGCPLGCSPMPLRHCHGGRAVWQKKTEMQLERLSFL